MPNPRLYCKLCGRRRVFYVMQLHQKTIVCDICRSKKIANNVFKVTKLFSMIPSKSDAAIYRAWLKWLRFNKIPFKKFTHRQTQHNAFVFRIQDGRIEIFAPFDTGFRAAIDLYGRDFLTVYQRAEFICSRFVSIYYPNGFHLPPVKFLEAGTL